MITHDLLSHFHDLPDPRRETMNKLHLFIDVLTIAICAVICGASDWTAIAKFGKAKKAWFKKFLELPNGIPSHDTFNNIFSLINPDKFQSCFITWVTSIAELLPGEVVAIDGKTLRRSHDKPNAKDSIHMVSAWASNNSLVLGQVKTDEKSNEITAIPKLLDVLDVAGCLITIDAMGCQKEIAKKIIGKDAEYLLAVKENQSKLLNSIKDSFSIANENGFKKTFNDYAETKEKGHGREEIRRCWVSDDLCGVQNKENWKHLNSLVVVESERTLNGETSIEHRYYISSAKNSASYFLKASRQHWGVENKLHWVMDMSFREDESRIRKGNGAENFSRLRHIALNLLKRETTQKIGIPNKRLLAGWDELYMKKVLLGLKT